MINKITRCRICDNTELVPVISLGIQSLTGVFPKSKSEKITSGPLELVKCLDTPENTTCGLVQLGHSYDKSEMYGDNYGYRSGLNNSMVSHLRDISNKIKSLINLKGDDAIVDIGSNDGTFLGMFAESMTKLIGIDPTITKFSRFYKKHIIKVPDFFSANNINNIIGNKKAKVISSIAMFYDLDRPTDFADQVYQVLADNGIWVLEQSYLLSMLQQNAYDTICHEHLEYYSLKQLKWVMDKNGFKIIDIEYNDTNGGSIRIIVAKNSSSFNECTEEITRALNNESNYGLNTIDPFTKFRDNIWRHKDKLVSLINDINNSNNKVLGYGASTKGNVLLQYCNLSTKDIPYITEINEDKFGSFTPNTLIPIISESQGKTMNPDYFLVLPWHFRASILKREESYLKQGGKLIFPLPQIEVVKQ